MEIEDSKNDQTPAPDREPNASWPKRLLWFIGIWALGIISLGAVTYFLRLLMKLP